MTVYIDKAIKNHDIDYILVGMGSVEAAIVNAIIYIYTYISICCCVNVWKILVDVCQCHLLIK